jgi:hypothetical protein
VYIYERQLGTKVVLVAINKNPSTDQAISVLYTDLVPGSYTDYLAQTMGGIGITVTGTVGGNNPVTNFTLPHRSVSIWVSAGTVPPSIGSITPRVANPGAAVTINGTGFGATAGTVNVTIGSTTVPATVTNSSNGQITVLVPALTAGSATVTVTQDTVTSSAAPFTVNTSALIPVNFSVSSTPTLASTDVIMLTGNMAELGNWATTRNGTIGPVTIPATGTALQTVSVLAGATVQFQFFVLHSDKSVTSENIKHSYTIPLTGVGTAAVTWQH